MSSISIKTRENDPRAYVEIERYGLRSSSWYRVSGTSHRNWIVTLHPDVELWLAEHDPTATAKPDFMHDDYKCYFNFTFANEEIAHDFARYMFDEWDK